MKLYKTSEKLISENYPYGYTLRTTKTDYLEFDKKRGFRHCSYTVNPKTGNLNAPKKSTYSDILVLGKNEENDHTQGIAFSFYDHKDIDTIIKFFSVDEQFNLFTTEQIVYIYQRLAIFIKTNINSQIIYCGSKKEDLLPLYEQQLKVIMQGIKDNGVTNIFKGLSFDWETIDSFKEAGYQPF